MPKKKTAQILGAYSPVMLPQTFLESVERLIEHVQQLSVENRNLRIALALSVHTPPPKNPRGRPKKIPKIKEPPKKRGRKAKPTSYKLLQEVAEAKKRHNVKSGLKAIQKEAESVLFEDGKRISRVYEKPMKGKIKTIYNKVSALRNPKNSSK